MCRNLGSDPCDPNLPAYLIIQGSPRSGSDDYTLSTHFYRGPKTCALILFLFFYEDLSIYAYLNAPKRHVRIWKKHLKHHGKSLFFMVIPVVSVASHGASVQRIRLCSRRRSSKACCVRRAARRVEPVPGTDCDWTWEVMGFSAVDIFESQWHCVNWHIECEDQVTIIGHK